MNSKFGKALLALLLGATSPLAAEQSARQLVIECAAATGHSYFFEANYSNSGRWQEDAIDGSLFALYKLASGDYDIEFTDRSGVRSYESEGMKLIEIMRNERYVMLGAFSFGHNATIYTFDLKLRTMGFTVNSTTLVEKIGAFSARCQ